MMKSTFSELQRSRERYGSIFIRLAVAASKNLRNSLKIRTQFKVIQGYRSWCHWCQ